MQSDNMISIFHNLRNLGTDTFKNSVRHIYFRVSQKGCSTNVTKRAFSSKTVMLKAGKFPAYMSKFGEIKIV